MSAGFPGGVLGLLATLLTGLCVFSSSGLIFGFSSILPILYREEVFARSCDHHGYGSGNCSTISATGNKCCDAQLAAFTAMSTVGFFMADASMIFYGELLDRAGPRPCFFVGSSLVLVGLGLLALSPTAWRVVYPDFMWVTAFALMGLGGPGCFLATLSFSERWRGIEPVISATAAAAFDSSSLVFFLFNTLYFDAGVPFYAICTGWMILIALAAGAMLLLLPTRSELTRLRADASLAEDVAAVPADAPTSSLSEPLAASVPVAEMDEHALPAAGAADRSTSVWQLFARSDTLLLVYFMVTSNVKAVFFIVSLSDVTRTYLPEHAAQQIDTTFNVAFPVGGLASAFVAMLLLRATSQRAHLYMGVAVGLAVAFSAASLLENETSQLIAALLFGPCRTLQWACYFHFLTSSGRYPAENVGRLIGYAGLAIALFSDGTPNLLSAFVRDSSWPDTARGRYELVAYALMVPIGLSVVFPISLWCSQRRPEPHAAEHIGHRADKHQACASINRAPFLLSHSLFGLRADTNAARWSTRSAPDFVSDLDTQASLQTNAPRLHAHRSRVTR
jgi:MFS family permease